MKPLTQEEINAARDMIQHEIATSESFPSMGATMIEIVKSDLSIEVIDLVLREPDPILRLFKAFAIGLVVGRQMGVTDTMADLIKPKEEDSK